MNTDNTSSLLQEADKDEEIKALREAYALQSIQLKATEKRLMDAELLLSVIYDKIGPIQHLANGIGAFLRQNNIPNPSTQ